MYKDFFFHSTVKEVKLFSHTLLYEKKVKKKNEEYGILQALVLLFDRRGCTVYYTLVLTSTLIPFIMPLD